MAKSKKKLPESEGQEPEAKGEKSLKEKKQKISAKDLKFQNEKGEDHVN